MKTEIELDDDLFFEASKLAHEKNITFNELVTNALEEYIENHPKQNDYKDNFLIRELKDATKNVVENGVTQDTMIRYGNAYSAWFNECGNEKPSRHIIQDGFDDVDYDL